MTNILEIETFDTSVLADAILGEDNELIFLDEREEALYADSAEDFDDEFDFPEDFGDDPEEPTEANFNLGWGTLEGEIFNSQWD
jgi:hypothetical protein